MEKILRRIANIVGTGRLFKFLFNISPMYRRSGGRIVAATNSLNYVKIKLRLNLRTRNYVGTLYGGHMYSCVDGIYMVQLINILGKKYVVWDKAATIKFKRPGTQRLFAEFKISDELIEKIKTDVEKEDEIDLVLNVNLVDQTGLVYAEVEKVIYISSKEFFKKKQLERAEEVK